MVGRSNLKPLLHAVENARFVLDPDGRWRRDLEWWQPLRPPYGALDVATPLANLLAQPRPAGLRSRSSRSRGRAGARNRWAAVSGFLAGPLEAGTQPVPRVLAARVAPNPGPGAAERTMMLPAYVRLGRAVESPLMDIWRAARTAPLRSLHPPLHPLAMRTLNRALDLALKPCVPTDPPGRSRCVDRLLNAVQVTYPPPRSAGACWDGAGCANPHQWATLLHPALNAESRP
jgi:hypothetical protein